MKIKFLTAVIILTLAHVMIAVPSSVYGQTRVAQQRGRVPTGGKAIASIEAAIIYSVGDPQPVARTTFRLLNVDLVGILRDAGMKTSDNSGTPLSTYGFVLLYGGDLSQVNQSIQSHTVASAMTDFKGRCQFKAVPAGVYYLTGFTSN